MNLKQLIETLGKAEVEGTVDREIIGIAYDSRSVTPNKLFIALRGSSVDGHNYIRTVAEKGASAVICEQKGPVYKGMTRIIVPDSRKAMPLIAAEFYGHPADKLDMIGVTGTNGKTTVTFLCKAILEKEGIRSGLLGTIRYEIDERMIPAQRTTPEAPDIQSMLSKMVYAGVKSCVMEVSSHALAQGRVGGICFNTGVFTNLTQDHLDYHGSMENYFECKKRLFQMGFEKNPSFKAVINIDDAAGRKLSEIFADKEFVFTYGLNSKAMIYADEVKLFSDYTQMKIYLPQGSFWIKIPMVGRFNVLNVLAAVGVGLAHRISPDRIIAALEKAPLISGRLERIVAGQPFTVLVDYAHTDDAMRNVLETLKELKKGKILTVFGCGGSRDKGKRFKMGAVAAEYSDYTIITSDNPRHEKPLDIALQVEKGYRSIREDGYEVELDRALAIERGIRAAQPEDIVLICGKGHETYQEFDGVLLPFDDRLQAYSALSSLNYCREEEN